jgi:hypothetical protein
VRPGNEARSIEPEPLAGGETEADSIAEAEGREAEGATSAEDTALEEPSCPVLLLLEPQADTTIAGKMKPTETRTEQVEKRFMKNRLRDFCAN